jgi:hypothetical protein
VQPGIAVPAIVLHGACDGVGPKAVVEAVRGLASR